MASTQTKPAQEIPANAQNRYEVTRADLPLRIAVINAATEAMGVVAPLAGGVLATALDFPSVFFAAIAFKLAAAALVALRLREPRVSRADS